ncbi:hypothetical protein BLNAU_2226 [Blattamonas nauphoetae]|uniref:Uncharacterized protein n=1 Tax=Blattamonas nauphoetae TaxID=2049346 RepID=A0ABQ9YGA2_9EUKA|nr:hypothetical protein BLNAU_2226 [Blattamonas nauphoetae]
MPSLSCIERRTWLILQIPHDDKIADYMLTKTVSHGNVENEVWEYVVIPVATAFFDSPINTTIYVTAAIHTNRSDERRANNACHVTLTNFNMIVGLLLPSERFSTSTRIRSRLHRSWRS